MKIPGWSKNVQEKFQLYLLSLVFTLLAFSVQGAKPGTHHALDII